MPPMSDAPEAVFTPLSDSHNPWRMSVAPMLDWTRMYCKVLFLKYFYIFFSSAVARL